MISCFVIALYHQIVVGIRVYKAVFQTKYGIVVSTSSLWPHVILTSFA